MITEATPRSIRVPAIVAEPAAEAESTVGVRAYDFRRPHRISHERRRTLEAMYERLAKAVEGWLVGRIRDRIELTLEGVEQQSFGEFTQSLPVPCNSYLLDIADAGDQRGVIDFGREFAFFLVDRLFGGGSATTVMDRALTPIERMAVRSVAERINLVLGEIWQDQAALRLEIGGFESIPEMLRAENRDDPMLVARIRARAGGVDGHMVICLPFAVLERFFSNEGQRRVHGGPSSERERVMDREVAESSLRVATVSVAARMPSFRLSMRELASLRVGGVLATGIPVDSELVLMVNGQQRFRVAPGRTGRRLAVRVTAPLHGEFAPSESSSNAT